jgi:DMSO/TMAO reductase YedYZ molybdopterin-dependent catalytic subunit
MPSSPASPPPSGTDDPEARDARPVPRLGAALSGVLAAALGLGVGELVSATVTLWPSPVVAVGDLVIDNAPPAVTSWAIDTFGTADKAVLIAGTLTLLGVAAAGLGALAPRRPGLALAGVGGFGAAAAFAVLQSPASPVTGLIPVLATTVTAAVTLLVLVTGLADRPPAALPGPARTALAPLGRRRFLELAGIVAVGAAATAAAGRTLLATFDVDAARAQLTLPAATDRVDLPLPPDPAADVTGLTPFVTSNEDFYRIDVNLELPRIDPETHVLRVTGMVDQPLEIPFRDLLARDLVEVPITMTCVSFELGGDLVGTAVWRGVRLRELLDEAGVSSDADQVVGRSVDGYTCGFPLEAAYDRDAMVVVGMNGDPLPLEHGFPLRLITPGIYGYVGATKWLSEIELTRFDAFDQYWVPRGYDAEAPIKTMSRIDTPQGLGDGQIDPGETVVAGVAWAQTRGVERVEVQVDDGDWQEAELVPAVNAVTWVQWTYGWDAEPGRHVLRVRATDGTGTTQTEERASIVPDGVSGWHARPVLVRDA